MQTLPLADAARRRRLLILCPDHGEQHAGMYALARSSSGAAALLERLAPCTDAQRLVTNRHGQPAVVAAGLALWQAVCDGVPAPTLVAGYGVGELTAWSVAGALTHQAAVQLAGVRARLMEQCLLLHPGQAQVALCGLAVERIAALIADDLFQVAVETGRDSCVAGGPAAALTAIREKVTMAGGGVERLPSDLAAHTPYMAAAVLPFAAALRGATFRAQAAPVLSGISAEAISGKAAAVEHLSRQLSETVRWADCMDAGMDAGVTVALELGPGCALTRLLQARHRAIACRSVAEFSSLDGLRHWLRQALSQD